MLVYVQDMSVSKFTEQESRAGYSLLIPEYKWCLMSIPIKEQQKTPLQLATKHPPMLLESRVEK